jgi:MFS family permease
VLPIFTLGSLGVALARTVPQLMLFRIVQAFGGGGGMSVGAGVISDIYRMEERGSAIGFFFAVSPFLLSGICASVCVHGGNWYASII